MDKTQAFDSLENLFDSAPGRDGIRMLSGTVNVEREYYAMRRINSNGALQPADVYYVLECTCHPAAVEKFEGIRIIETKAYPGDKYLVSNDGEKPLASPETLRNHSYLNSDDPEDIDHTHVGTHVVFVGDADKGPATLPNAKSKTYAFLRSAWNCGANSLTMEDMGPFMVSTSEKTATLMAGLFEGKALVVESEKATFQDKAGKTVEYSRPIIKDVLPGSASADVETEDEEVSEETLAQLKSAFAAAGIGADANSKEIVAAIKDVEGNMAHKKALKAAYRQLSDEQRAELFA